MPSWHLRIYFSSHFTEFFNRKKEKLTELLFACLEFRDTFECTSEQTFDSMNIQGPPLTDCIALGGLDASET